MFCFRNSYCIEGGPAPKYVRNINDHSYIRGNNNCKRTLTISAFIIKISLSDEAFRSHSLQKTSSLIAPMGSIFSRFKLKSSVIESTENDEYSDEEDIIVIRKLKKKNNKSASRIHEVNNVMTYKMDAVNSRPYANRPVPALIPKSKWSRMPNLQKYMPQQGMINGYQHENESSSSSSKSSFANGNNMLVRTANNIYPGNQLSFFARNYYHNSVVNGMFISLFDLHSSNFNF